MTEGTLVFIIKDDRVLLAMKKRGFGEGKWNGPGGKIHFGEAPIDAAIRETQEEIGVTPVLRRELGFIIYHDPKFGDWSVHVFRSTSFKGEPVESEEMKPQWWAISAMPFDQMWAGDDQWMPHVLRDHPFKAEVWADGKGGVTKVEIQ